MAQIPFTIHIRVVPARGKRFEYVRDLQKIGVDILDELDGVTELNLAQPGGGQHKSYGGTAGGGLSGYADGFAVKPQIGQTPAQLQITGFYDDSAAPAQAHPNKQLLHTGTAQTGPAGGHQWQANPRTATDDNAKTIKGLFETAAMAVLGLTDWNVFRLEVSGTVYGDRGAHFPR
jgi:hypothetical protein